MATAKELAEWYTKLAENDNGFTYDDADFGISYSPNLTTNITKCKVNPPKPKVKIIDLSMMVGSDIDMETIGKEEIVIGKLTRIDKHVYPYCLAYTRSNKCRIRQDHWHHWNGGKCPLPEGLDVDLKFRDGEIVRGSSFGRSYTAWNHDMLPNDIIAFKVIGTAEGWQYEWEKD